MDITSERGSNSGGVVKVTRELLVSRDGDQFFFVRLCFWYFWQVKIQCSLSIQVTVLLEFYFYQQHELQVELHTPKLFCEQSNKSLPLSVPTQFSAEREKKKQKKKKLFFFRKFNDYFSFHAREKNLKSFFF